MRLFLSLALLAIFTAPVPGQDNAVERIVRSFERVRPTDSDLAFYSLDWVDTLADARARARVEKRPVFFIWLTNKSGPTNFFSGHC